MTCISGTHNIEYKFHNESMDFCKFNLSSANIENYVILLKTASNNEYNMTWLN